MLKRVRVDLPHIPGQVWNVLHWKPYSFYDGIMLAAPTRLCAGPQEIYLQPLALLQSLTPRKRPGEAFETEVWQLSEGGELQRIHQTGWVWSLDQEEYMQQRLRLVKLLTRYLQDRDIRFAETYWRTNQDE